MGDFGSIVGAVLTGGVSLAADAVDSSGTVSSIMSGGMSDIAEGNPWYSATANTVGNVLGPGLASALSGGMYDLAKLDVPFTGASEAIGPEFSSLLSGGISDVLKGETLGAGTLKGINDIVPEGTLVGQLLPSMLMPVQSMVSDVKKVTESDGTLLDKITGIADEIFDPTSMVNYTLEGAGDALIPSSLKPYVQPIATGVGALFGPVGAAIGSGVGSHLGGNESSTDAQISALASYLGGSMSDEISPIISDLAGGGTIGNIAGGAVEGATKGAISATPTAIKTGNLTPLAYGAGIGGLIGGTSAGGSELYDYITSPNASSIADQSMIDAYNNRPVSFIDEYTKQNPSYTPITTDPTLGITPQVLPYNPFSTEILQNVSGVQTNQPTLMGTKTPEKVYTDAASKDMFYRPSTDPNQIGTLGKVFDKEPSIWNSIQDYAGKAGRFVLDNPNLLKNLASILSGAGAATMGVGETGVYAGKSTPDIMSDFLMQNSGTGVGKSKGLKAGYAEGPKYDAISFMPDNRDIEKYNKQDLYYT
jgi:hypothetical protein